MYTKTALLFVLLVYQIGNIIKEFFVSILVELEFSEKIYRFFMQLFCNCKVLLTLETSFLANEYPFFLNERIHYKIKKRYYPI